MSIPSPTMRPAALSASFFATRHRHDNPPSARPNLTKIYRQASTLFLTRRLPEALTTLAPLVHLASDAPASAAVAAPSRAVRIKVWSLYLAILYAVLELEPDQGKDGFGALEWRAMCAKVRSGAIWDEVVQSGYAGVHGDVDAEVVINLTTLLITHSRNLKGTQDQLETYLATSTWPTGDLSRRLSDASSHAAPAASHRHASPAYRGGDAVGGHTTPAALTARVRILELYTLHILPRNDEWDYARDFISMSPVLDDERRDAFLQALQSLRDDRDEQVVLDRQHRQHEDDALRTRLDEEKRRARDADTPGREREWQPDGGGKTPPSSREHHGDRGGSIRPVSLPPGVSAKAALLPPAAGRHGRQVPRPTLAARAALLFAALPSATVQLAAQPLLMVQILAFTAAIVFSLSRRAVRERLFRLRYSIVRLLAKWWAKIFATVGMGVKMSSI